MNYYRRYSGDYLRDTARLNMTEHGAYTLLMDYYYSEEEPPPLDRDEIYLMVRAIRPEDQAAVDKVLRLYFEERPDGFHQKRIDHEIECAQQARLNGQLGAKARWGSDAVADAGSDRETDGVADAASDSGLNGGMDRVNGGGLDRHSNHQPPSSSPQPPTSNLQPQALPPSAFAPMRRKNGVASRPTGAPKIEFDLQDGFDRIPPHLSEAWKTAYPAINVFEEINRAEAWLKSNPDKRKSRYDRFLNNWLKRAQDRAR